MRISQHYVKVFINAIDKFLPSKAKAELRLYGSRIDDKLKGGDIDLLLIVDTPKTVSYLKQHKPEIFAAIFSCIDEQKIDLLIVERELIPQNSFATMALENSLNLHNWE